jgi:hypothetical protein
MIPDDCRCSWQWWRCRWRWWWSEVEVVEEWWWNVSIDDPSSLATTKTVCRCSLRKMSHHEGFESSCTKSIFQKSYSPSISVGLQRRGVSETWSSKRWCTQMIGMERLRRQHSSEYRKILFGYLRIFQLEFPIVVFVVSISRRIDTYI